VCTIRLVMKLMNDILIKKLLIVLEKTVRIIILKILMSHLIDSKKCQSAKHVFYPNKEKGILYLWKINMVMHTQ